MDVVTLSRIQFAVTIGYHFLFVPLSIGLGLIVVLAERRHYLSGLAEDQAASNFWIKLFTATFAVGVATGIAMEFAFGTNWAEYSRFVGDIFGAPLAAEALFAFFMESTFLAILLFGRGRVSKKFFYVSTWLVWGGSMLSALWIIIANSWMQTPAGFDIVTGATGAQAAVLTDFFAAALNPSMLPRYAHTVDATLAAGAFTAMAVSAYYLLKGKHVEFAKKSIGAALAVAAISTLLMLPLGHWQAATVVETQPSKLAAMEGMWEDAPAPLGIIGWVDEANKTTTSIEIPGMVSFLTYWNFDTVSKGLNSFPADEIPPVNLTYQTYHAMILLWGAMVLIVLWVWWARRKGTMESSKALLKIMLWGPIVPMLAIQLGWATAEVGRQPWIVWQTLKTADAVSTAVPAGEVATTLVLFTLFYSLLYVAWARVVLGYIKKGPELPEAASATKGEAA